MELVGVDILGLDAVLFTDRFFVSLGGLGSTLAFYLFADCLTVWGLVLHFLPLFPILDRDSNLKDIRSPFSRSIGVLHLTRGLVFWDFEFIEMALCDNSFVRNVPASC